MGFAATPSHRTAACQEAALEAAGDAGATHGPAGGLHCGIGWYLWGCCEWCPPGHRHAQVLTTGGPGELQP